MIKTDTLELINREYERRNMEKKANVKRRKAKAKQDKVLEIICNKNVDIDWFKRTKYCEEYNDGLFSERFKPLIQEEYDLLKEELEHGQN